MDKTKNIVQLILIGVAMTIIAQNAIASPEWVIFWSVDGTTLDGTLAPIGTVIRIEDGNGNVCGNWTVGDTPTNEGDYVVNCYITDPPVGYGTLDSGETAVFYINGILATPLGPDNYTRNYSWKNGDYKNVNLAATTPRQVNSTNQTGTQEVNVFSLGELIYARGSGFVKNSNVSICVVNHTYPWTDGMPIPQDVRGGSCNNSVPVDGNGAFGPVFLWNGSVLGGFDIVVDQDGDNYYNSTRDGVDSTLDEAGFYIYPEAETVVLFAVGLIVLFGFMKIKPTKKK